MLAPKNIETAWIQFENNFVEALAKKKWIKPFLFFLCLTIAYLTHSLWTQNSFPAWTRFNLIQDKLWASYVLIFMSFVPLFIKPLRASSGFLLLAVSASWLFPLFQINSVSANAALPIVYLVICAFVVKASFIKRWMKALLVLVLFLILTSLITRNAINSENKNLLLYFSNIHLDLLLLYFIGAIFNDKPFATQIHFNPLQMIAPAPLPESAQMLKEDTAYEKNFINGIFGLVLAQAIFIFLIFFLRQEAIANSKNPLVYYLLFILMVVAAMRMATSILRIYGIKVISASYFVILAKSPIEVWQRGAVYIADFLFNNIYLPTWKKFRSMWLASLAVVIAILVHLFIFHEVLVKTLLRLQFGNLFFGSFGGKEVLQWALWVAIWFVWISLFAVFAKMTKAWHPKPIFQWVLVVLTHLGSASIFPIVFYLSRVISI